MIKYCDVAPVFSFTHSHGAVKLELLITDVVKMVERVGK
ncbi:Putative uncharacterized protein [Moritella viscosa]|uniref:Uncharacterized protein n=1 Tax=Moritella viscosa TaxID=80854 RepID=A0A1K9ZQT1_9GAMM|nr:Putative uncharacterized protein [Moritella viscosa]SGY96129.1 Putative uncharacterized protein [Moritella viscosa]SGY96520.1 Putative uncharacterized protein [Moritella viscosa]SGZ01651.1 Putative uncharacterized protein [Moritella viscosa]SGZ02083.1 Putative uncharacterized protein [Moritella viscosa]